MADNSNMPFGFRAIRNPAGTAPLAQVLEATKTANIYAGMPVMYNASALVVGWTMTVGTFSSCIGIAATGRKTTDTARSVVVNISRDQEYEVQLATTGATALLTTLAALVYTSGNRYRVTEITMITGNTTTLESNTALDDARPAAANVSGTIRPFIVTGFSPIMGQDITGAYARVICRIDPQNMAQYQTKSI